MPVKQPQDRKPKATAAAAEATASPLVIEHGGRTYTVDTDWDDVELLEDVTDIAAGDNPAALRLVRRLLGPAQWRTFKAASRDAEGRVRTESLGELFDALMQALGNRTASPGS